MRRRTSTPWLYPVGRYLILPTLRKQYKLRVVGAELFETVSPPFVVVGNHSTYYDGFFLASGIRQRVYMLVTDSLMHGALGELIKRTGAVPMTKNMLDVGSIRQMLELVGRGKVIGLFPEGQTTWHGGPGTIYPSVGKLVKLLGVPIVAATMKGGYHIHPKWSPTRREGSLTVEYRLVADAAAVGELPAGTLNELVQSAVAHDDLAFIQDNGLSYPSNRGAEYLERALYHCPRCEALGHTSSGGNIFRCEACGSEWLWDGRGLLHPQSAEPDSGAANTADGVTIREWIEREKAALGRELTGRLNSGDLEPIYPPDEVTVWRGFRTARRRRVGRGLLSMTPDAYVFESARRRLVFPMSELSACQVMEANQFEFYYDGRIYVFSFARPRSSGLKYLHGLQIRNPQAAEVT